MNTDYPLLLELNNYFKGFVDKFKTKVITMGTDQWHKKATPFQKEISKIHFFQVISFGETLPTQHMGVNMTFVPPESSNPGVGDFYTVPFNHMDICKPSSRKSILFRLAS